ncbi:MAG: TlyA family RNA methyltransferase [Clostridia bacterium]|nr:TlyA family RNA methyltransferase [Clostridia bacterium]
MRLDLYMVENDYAVSRTAAQRMIAEGGVSVNGRVVDKPSFDVGDGARLSVTDSMEYVSRGGYKLKGAIDAFEIDVSGDICLDIGASSGGFTDCLLSHGAEFVYAVDSGINQLHPTLRENARVESREKCNARYLSRADFDKRIDTVVIDVSFISQRLILPSVAEILDVGGKLITLIKPQFEVGRSGVGKKGIVKDERLRKGAREEIITFATTLGFEPVGSITSPILGGDGNEEYLAYFRKK